MMLPKFYFTRGLAAILLLTLSSAFAQKGDFFVKSFIVEADRIDNPYFSIQQSEEGLVYVSNRSGVLVYDGYRWDRIPCPGAVFSMSLSDNNLLVAGKFGFGYLTEDQKFISLSDSIPGAKNAYSVASDGQHAVFQTDNQLYIFDLLNFKLSRTISSEGSSFLNLLKYGKRILIVSQDNSMKEVTNGILADFDDFGSLEGRPVFLEKAEDGWIFGTNENRIYRIVDNRAKKLLLEDEGYLSENIVTSATWIDSHLLAVGTLRGGVAFFDPTTGKLVQISNSHTGLSDNEVMGMVLDRDRGLWVTENNGLDRISPFLPVRNFSNFPGLNGKMVSTFSNNGQLYVSTTLGVYHLSEVRDYNEVVKLIRVDGKSQRGKNTMDTDALADQDPLQEADTVAKKRFLGFLRKKKNDSIDNTSSKRLFTRIFGRNIDPENDSSEAVYTERIFRELQSIRYVYRRIVGINSRSPHFEAGNGQLINAGLSGIFEITGDSSVRISYEPARDILLLQDGTLLVSTLEDDILTYAKKGGRWRLIERIDGLGDNILYMYEDSKGNIWMTGNTGVYKLSFSAEEPSLSTYSINNPYSDKTLVVENNGKINFINPTGYYVFDENRNEIILDEELKKSLNLPAKYFGFDKLSTWISVNDFWYGFHEKDQGFSRELALSLVRNIKYITYDPSGDLFWIITTDNTIFSVDNISEALKSNYELYLKSVRQTKKNIGTNITDHLTVNELDGSVAFEYVHPDYSGVLGIKYRYKLEGTEGDWTEWSENNIIRFPYLPPGDYAIKVQSKDIFGQINESENLSFSILPPYWNRPWFYALEVLVFALLLFASIRLNRSNKPQYLILNRLLAFLTLILLVEYVQVVGEAKFGDRESPVFDFFIQVCIAAAILPVEHILRKWLIAGELPKIKKRQKLENSISDEVSEEKTTVSDSAK